MLRDAVEYPVAGDEWVRTTVLGGGLYLVAVVLQFVGLGLTVTGILAVIGIPIVLLSLVAILPLWGYSVRVSRSVLAGHEEPPAFDDPGELVREGAAVLVVSLVYGVPWLLLGVLALVGVGVGAVLPDDLGGVVVALVLVVAGLLGAVYALVYYYVLPAALVTYAGTGELGAAWDVGAIRDAVTDGDYAVGWALGAVVWAVGQSVANSLAFVLVGFAVFFYVQVAATYLFTRGVADATGGAIVAAGTAGPAVEEEPGETDDVPPPSSGGSSGASSSAVGPDDEAGATSSGDESGATPAGDGSGPDDDGRTDGEPGGDLVDVSGVGPAKAEALREAGFESVADLRAASREDLTAVEGIGPAFAERIKDDVGDA